MRHLDGGKEADQFDNSSDYEAADKTKELFRSVYITMHFMKLTSKNWYNITETTTELKKINFHAFVLNTYKSWI